MGVFGFVGGNVNFAGSYTTPLLTPRRPPETFGFGPIWGNASLLTLTPSASLRLSDRLSVGGGPVISPCRSASARPSSPRAPATPAGCHVPRRHELADLLGRRVPARRAL